MYKHIAYIVAGLVISLTLASAQLLASESTRPLVYLEFADMPPFSYKQNNIDRGTIVDALDATLKPLGLEYRVQHMPHIERLYSEAMVGNGDLVMVHTYPGLTLEDYPDYLLICPTPLSRIPIRYYTYNIGFSALAREDLKNLRIGVFRYASFQRGLTKKEQLDNLTRFNNMRYMFRALLADRIDLAIGGPYMMRVLSQQHGSYYPFELDVDLGNMESFLAISQKAESELGIHKSLCQQATKWRVETDFRGAVGRHMEAYLKSIFEQP